MPSVMAVMNFATMHRTAPTRFFPQKHHATKTDLIQGIDKPTPEGTDHIPCIMVPDMGDILAGHSPTAIPTMTEAAVSEYISHSSAGPHSSTHCPLANRCPHHYSWCDPNWHSHIPSHTHLFSHRWHSCYSTDWCWSHSSNSHCTAQETQPRKAKLHS